MSFPKVLITTYHHAYLVKGGGEYEIFSIADTLKQHGFIVDIYGPYSRSLDDYDVVLHFSVHGGGLELLEQIKEAKIPIVLWPNLWVRDDDVFSPELINSYLSLADVIIFKSLAEKNNFAGNYELPNEKCRDITLSVDNSYLTSAPPELFKTLYGLDEYAIWFGVIERNKNQLQAVKVLRNRGIKLVLVGTARSKSYLQSCLDAGGDGILVIPNLPYKSEIVRSALQGAIFYIEVGYEPAGISAIEAGLSGCKLVLSDSEWSREHFGNDAFYADPRSEESLIKAVDAVTDQRFNKSPLNESLRRFCLPQAIQPLVDILKSLIR